ncbi:DEAD/DEAH box helicase [Hirschia litorea]|uniref:DEAD/DEAH box helicase n=1 Tax=Hirschia litorea TaxID=1199156 RepID=A0ABW2IKL1_9PROT
MTTFSDFDLAGPVLKALTKEGYETPTPIQAQAIPLVMEGGDILGIAQTGTGKTAAFALPLLHHLCKYPDMPAPGAVRCLVIAPTRELASQIAEAFSKYGQCLSLRVVKVFGGVPIRKQMRDLHRGADVLVATPGRLIDLMEQNAVDLSYVEKLVLDEADQMLDLGFIHPLRRIAGAVPEDRQTLFFSATMPDNVSGLSKQFLKNPKKVSIAQESTTAERVDQSMTHVNAAQKAPLLLVKLQDESIDRALVFTRTKHGADKVVNRLLAAGIRCSAIHGNKSQGQRERALNAFRNGDTKVLVATDIAARGIDVPGVSHVFNYEIPNVPEQYVHRIGRTARAGREGQAISFVARDEKKYLLDIQRQIRMKIPIVDLPDGFVDLAEEITANATPIEEERPRGRGGRDGGRGGRDGGRGGRDGGRGGRDGGRGGRDGARGSRDGGRGGYKGRDDRGDRGDRPQREDRPFRADARTEPAYEPRAERSERPNRDDRFARRERPEGGRGEGRGYQGNREGGRSEGGRGEGRGYQGNREGGRSEGGRGEGRGYQGNREGGRSEGGRGEGRGYQGRREGGRSEGGRGEGRGYQGRREGGRDGGRDENRGGYQGREGAPRREGPNRAERLAGERPPSRGYEGSNPRPRTEYDKKRAADGRSWGQDRKEGGRPDNKRGGERTWKRPEGGRSDGPRQDGYEEGASRPTRGRSERPTYPGTRGGNSEGRGFEKRGGGDRFEKRGPRGEGKSDARGDKAGFGAPKKPSGGKPRRGPAPGPKSKGPFSGRKPSFAR